MTRFRTKLDFNIFTVTIKTKRKTRFLFIIIYRNTHMYQNNSIKPFNQSFYLVWNSHFMLPCRNRLRCNFK